MSKNHIVISVMQLLRTEKIKKQYNIIHGGKDGQCYTWPLYVRLCEKLYHKWDMVMPTGQLDPQFTQQRPPASTLVAGTVCTLWNVVTVRKKWKWYCNFTDVNISDIYKWCTKYTLSLSATFFRQQRICKL